MRPEGRCSLSRRCSPHAAAAEAARRRRRRAEGRPELRELAATTSTRADSQVRRADGPTTLEQFKEKTGIKVNYYEDDQLERRSTSRRSRARSRQGNGIGRDIFVSTDNSRSPASTSPRSWVAEARQEPHPEHRRTSSTRRQSPPLRPEPRRTRSPGSPASTGIALERGPHRGPVTSMTAALRRTRSSRAR